MIAQIESISFFLVLFITLIQLVIGQKLNPGIDIV